MSWGSTQKNAPPQRTAQDRDADLERSYHFHREHPYESLPAHVSRNREALALEFFGWSAKQSFEEEAEAMLVRFEEDRFGRALEPSAHAMLRFAANYRKEHMRAPKDSPFESESDREVMELVVLALPPIEGEGMEDRLRRIAINSGLMVAETAKKPLVRSVSGAPLPMDQREVRLPYRDDAETELRQPGEDDEPVEWLESDPE